MYNSSSALEINPNYVSSNSGLAFLQQVYDAFFQSDRTTIFVEGLSYISLPKPIKLTGDPTKSEQLTFVQEGSQLAYVRKTSSNTYHLLISDGGSYLALEYSKSPEQIDFGVSTNQWLLSYIKQYQNLF